MIGEVVSLATVGTVLTALLAGLVAAWLFDLKLVEGLLLGSILASTDGAAVFAVLRGSTLRRRLARTLEGEAGLNDPVAVVLVLGFMSWSTDPHYGLLNFVWLFIRQLGIGLAIGGLVSVGAVAALRHLPLPSAGLYPWPRLRPRSSRTALRRCSTARGFSPFTWSDWRSAAFPRPAQRTIATFHDGLAWAAQLTLFVVLGLLVLPDQLGSVAVKATILAAVVAVVARPAAVALATAFSVSRWPSERCSVGRACAGRSRSCWRRSRSSRGVPHRLEFFNIVFFAVLVSTVVRAPRSNRSPGD